MTEATFLKFTEAAQQHEEGPEFVAYLKNRDISNFEPDSDMAASVIATMKRSECRTCKKKLEHVRRCSQCKVAAYCDRNCQTTDYPLHKTTCAMEATILALMKDHRAGRGIFQ